MTYATKKAAIKILSDRNLQGNWIMSIPGIYCQNDKEYLVIKKKLLVNIISIKLISFSPVFLVNLKYKTENTIAKAISPTCGENDSSPIGLGPYPHDGTVSSRIPTKCPPAWDPLVSEGLTNLRS